MASDTVVVGGGLSGTLVAIQLLRRLSSGDTVTVIERSGECGRGIAYGTQNIEHLLNVPAMGMTAFPDKPNDFAEWLGARKGQSADELKTTFAPRMVYSQYIRERLQEAIEGSSAKFKVVADAAVGARREGNRVHIQLENGGKVEADKVVLALGNHPPASPGLLASLEGTEVYKANPWEPCTLTDLNSDDQVLLVGTGLTMVDTVVSLLGSGHRGRIVAFSRRGLLPRCHQLGLPPLKLDLSETPMTTRGISRAILNGARANVQAGGDWRPAIDGLRSETPKIWAKLPWDERKRFLRRLTPYWDVHRHRLAPEIYHLLMQAIERGQLQIVSANITAIEPHDAYTMVTLKTRDGQVERLDVARIVNCTGPDTNLKRSKISLVESLIDQDLAEYDPLGMGLMVDDLGATKTDGLYAIGPVCRGCRWETTAAPEIRVQAEAIAKHIAG